MNALAPPPSLLTAPAQAADTQALAKRGEVRATAEAFEASFLGVMLQQMFQHVETSAPFGGGHGEAMYKSFLSEAFAKQIAKSGGVGLADDVAREMLKLQGLD